MTRTVIAVDRLATLVVGLLLLAGGIVAVLTWYDVVPALPRSVDLSPVGDAAGTAWWPWAVAGAGVVLLLIGLRWLASHVRRQGVRELRLAGSGPQGRLRASATPVARAAGQALARTPGVRSCHGRVLHERGHLVVRLAATLEPDTDLASVARACDQVGSELSHVLDGVDLRADVRLTVAGRARTSPRVS